METTAVTGVCKKCKRKKPIADFMVERRPNPCKHCSRCRSLGAARCARYKKNNPLKLHESQTKFKSTAKGKALAAKDKARRAKPEVQAVHAAKARERRATPEYKEYLQSDAYKESRRREYLKNKATPGWSTEHSILVTIGDTLGNRRSDFSHKLSELTEWTSREDMMTFFESHPKWESGMTWQNHSHQGWTVGHKIARSHYSKSPEDIKRSYMKMNIFPQWSKGPGGNCAMQTKFPPVDELLALRPCWPLAWNGALPSNERLRAMERAMYQKHK